MATGDTGYIVAAGARMLLFTVAQIAASIAATYFSAGVAMAAGRTSVACSTKSAPSRPARSVASAPRR